MVIIGRGTDVLVSKYFLYNQEGESYISLLTNSAQHTFFFFIMPSNIIVKLTEQIKS